MIENQIPAYLPKRHIDFIDQSEAPGSPAAGFHRMFSMNGVFYRKTPAGLITRIENTSELYYGVKWTIGQSNPVITQVGKLELIAEMPYILK